MPNEIKMMDKLRAAYPTTEESQAAVPQASVQSPVEQLRNQYAAEDSLAQSTQGIPGFEQPEVQAPFLNQEAQRAQEIQTAEQADPMAQMQALAAQKQAEFQEAQRLAAEQGVANAQMAKAQADADKQIEVDSIASNQLKQEDDQAALTVREIFQKGSLGQKLGSAISILIGGYAQGLTGAAKNPVLDFLDKVDTEILNDRQLQAKERAAVRQHMLDIVDQKLKQAKANVDDAHTRAQIDKLRAETGKIGAEIQDARNLQKLGELGSKITNPSQVPPEQREALVRLPDGNFALAPMGKDAAKEVRTFMGETGPVVGDIKDLINFTKDKRFYNPIGEDKARVQTKIATMIGALRLPITGPGPLTDTERTFLIETIGDPSKFFTLKQNEMARLSEIQDNINRRVKNKFSQAGIDLDSSGPKTQEDRLTETGITPDRKAQIVQYLEMKKASKTQK